ncbi:MAG: M48 family metallopeptidase, partial [Bacteroidia bacterium]|nr:M48 family metallopeptidase [Bacteroidia bacterium]
MKKIFVLCLCACLLTGCALSLLTGRNQLSLVKESDLQLMAVSQYKTFLSENKVLNSATSRDAATVDRIGARIANAITKYYNNQGKESLLEGYVWEFNTVESKEINAWCMPGGKVVVYTGILPVTKDDKGLAVVLGHEIAHAIADHGNERMSEGLLTQ